MAPVTRSGRVPFPTGANLGYVNFSDANLTNATLKYASVIGTRFARTVLTGVDLTEARYNIETVWPDGFDYLSAGMWGPRGDYSGRNLRYLEFWGQDFQLANFTGADLTGAGLGYVNFFDANLTDANLSRSYMVGTVLTGANVTGAIFSGAQYSVATVWPAGFDPVLATAVVSSVEVSPDTVDVLVGETVQLAATIRDSTGMVLSGRTVTWESLEPAVATVSTGGLVTAISAGTATITATREGVTGTAVVRVSTGG